MIETPVTVGLKECPENIHSRIHLLLLCSEVQSVKSLCNLYCWAIAWLISENRCMLLLLPCVLIKP